MKKVTKMIDPPSDDTVEHIYRFLQGHPVGVFVTSESAKKPYAAVIYFSVNEDFELYFITRAETRKYKNLEYSDQVSLVSFDPVSQVSVQITGVAQEVDENSYATTLATTAQKLFATHNRMPPITKLDAGEYKVIEIIPSSIRMSEYQPNQSEKPVAFETLNFHTSSS